MNTEAKVNKVDNYKYLELDGLEVHLYREEGTDQLVVAIYSHDLSDSDTISGGLPNIHLVVNDSRESLDEDGNWIRV